MERDSIKWFKPVKGQFNLYYKNAIDMLEYIPDFVAELNNCVLMVETKAKNDMQNDQVLAKAQAGAKWCEKATDYLLKHDGKTWKYLLIPHNQVLEQNRLESFVSSFLVEALD